MGSAEDAAKAPAAPRYRHASRFGRRRRAVPPPVPAARLESGQSPAGIGAPPTHVDISIGIGIGTVYHDLIIAARQRVHRSQRPLPTADTPTTAMISRSHCRRLLAPRSGKIISPQAMLAKTWSEPPSVNDRGALGTLRPSTEIRQQREPCYSRYPCCLLYTSPSPRDRTRSRLP